MSQVKFKCFDHDGTFIEVVAGYDVQIGGYHLTIFKLPEDETIWCNLDHFPFPGMPATTEPLKNILNKMNIKAPDGFWSRVEMNEGNVIHTYAFGRGWS